MRPRHPPRKVRATLNFSRKSARMDAVLRLRLRTLSQASVWSRRSVRVGWPDLRAATGTQGVGVTRGGGLAYEPTVSCSVTAPDLAWMGQGRSCRGGCFHGRLTHGATWKRDEDRRRRAVSTCKHAQLVDADAHTHLRCSAPSSYANR